MEETKPRFSLSISSTNPMAESTQINATNSSDRFPWGGGTVICPKRRSSTSSLTSGNMVANRVQTTISPINKTKIDPRVYIDVHSKGLTSRIVRYHEHNAGLNRSLSSSSLYNKPGQFPLVHLKTTEKPCIAGRKLNLSMVRIAPPEKSVFQGSTLSSILRSGSVVGISSGFQKCGTNISHENRPILHPPPTENEMAPTRSVLEVLKEISRKRINSDELDANDSAKKHRKDHETELQEQQLVPDSTKQLHQSITRQKSLVVKRQRENHSSSTLNQQMPSDQICNKRLCRNNDIASSLSSSKMLMIKTKRKKEYNGNDSLDSFRKPKQMCSEICNVEDNLNTLQSSIDNPITYRHPVMIKSSEQPTVQTSFENIVDSKQKSPTKSKVTLFNRDYGGSKELQTEIINETNTLAIQFVKPKKNGSICTTKNVVIERSQKSKLALMLSGLKGELNDEEEHDSYKTEQKKSSETELKITDSNASQVEAIISFDTTTTTVTTTITSPVITSKLSPTQQNNNLHSKFKLNAVNEPLSLPVPISLSSDFAPILHGTTSSEVVGSLKPATVGGFKFDHPTKTSLMSAMPVQPLPTNKSSLFVSSSQFTTNAPTSTNSVSIMKTCVNTLSDSNSIQDHNASNKIKAAESSSLNPSFSFGSSVSVAPVDKSSFVVPSFTFGTKAASSIVSTTISTSSTSTFTISSLASKNSNSNTSFSGNSLPSTLNLQSNSSTAGTELPSLSTPTSLTKTSTNRIMPSFGNNESQPLKSLIGAGIDANHQNTNLGLTPLDNHTSTSTSFNLVTQSFGTTSFINAHKAPISKFCSSLPTVSTSSSLNSFRFGNNEGENSNFNSLGHGDSIPIATSTANGFSFPYVPQEYAGVNTIKEASATQSKTSIFDSSQSIMPHKGFGDSKVTTSIESKSIFGGASVLQPNAGFSIFGATNNQTPDSSGQSKAKQNNATTFVFGDSTSGKTTASNTFAFNALPMSSSNVPAKFNSGAFANSSIQLKTTQLEPKNSFASSTLTNESCFNFGNSATTTNSKPSIFGPISLGNANAKQQSNDKNLFGGFDSSTKTQMSPSTPSSNPSNNIFGSSLASLRESQFEPSGPHKVFSFNAGTTSNSGNSLILNGKNQSKPDSAPAFSFGQSPAAQAPSLNSVFLGNSAQQLDSNNLMNLSMPGQPMINDRPIRKATRRLHK